MIEQDLRGDYFIENIDQWFDVFQDAHRDVSGYNDEPDPNYDWNWEEFIDLLGL